MIKCKSKGKTIMWTILIVILAVLSLVSIILYRQNMKAPTLGVTSGLLSPAPRSPNGVSSQTVDSNKYVEPFPFKNNEELTMAALIKAVEGYGGAQVVTQTSHYLYVIFTSDLLKFKDDTEFYLDVKIRKVHFRSASRAGKSDLGVNRKRYQALLDIYTNQP